MVDWFNSVSGMTGTIWTLVQIVLGMVLVTIICIIVYIFMKYKHKIRVRELTGGKTRIMDDIARDVTDAEGVLKWKLLKRGHCIPVPPAECVHLTKNGKFSVEAYYLPEGEYKFVKDNGVKKDTKDGKYIFIEDGGVNTEKLVNFEPLDTADREFYASEMREAETYKRKDWKEYILPIAGMFSVLAVLVLMLVFWEDIAKPGITIVNSASGVAEQQHETAKILRDTIQNRQTIENIEQPTNNEPGET